MKKAAILLAVLTAAAIVAVSFFMGGQGYVIAMTQSEIQSVLDERFPAGKSALIFTVTFQDPKVRLEHGSDRIRFEITARTNFKVNDVHPEGRGTIESEIGYNPGKGEFYLREPVLELEIGGLDRKQTLLVNEAANTILESHISRYPIYRLKKTSLKENMARLVLRDVRVEGGLLKITLGLKG